MNIAEQVKRPLPSKIIQEKICPRLAKGERPMDVFRYCQKIGIQTSATRIYEIQKSRRWSSFIKDLKAVYLSNLLITKSKDEKNEKGC